MRAPIIAANKGDVLLFDSVQKAERYLEPIDIRNNEYVIYDRDGRLLRGIIITRLFGTRVRLQAVSEPGVASTALRQVLLAYLNQVAPRRDSFLEERSLEELLQDALPFKTE